jgi:hypothetical protein
VTKGTIITAKMPSGSSPALQQPQLLARVTLARSSAASTGPSAGLIRQRSQM